MGICGYLLTILIKSYPKIFPELPAAISKLISEKPIQKIEEKITEEVIEEIPEVKAEKKEYLEIAEKGEGITHLARKALKSYLEENGSKLNLTPEHKIYIEDYIKDRTGDRWLKLGETLTFSEELIAEAIKKTQGLTPNQLENLKQYSRLVSF